MSILKHALGILSWSHSKQLIHSIVPEFRNLRDAELISKYFFFYLISYCYMEIVCNFVGVNSYIIRLDIVEIQVQLLICCLVCETHLLSNQGSYQLNKRQASAHNILPKPGLRFMERKRRSGLQRSKRQ